MGYRLNPKYDPGAGVVVVVVGVVVVVLGVSGDVVAWFGREGGRRREAQPKYTPDSISAIHGVRLSSTERLAVGIPRSWEPRPKPLITLPSIRKGYGASRPADEPMMSERVVDIVVISTPRTVMLLVEAGSVGRGR